MKHLLACWVTAFCFIQMAWTQDIQQFQQHFDQLTNGEHHALSKKAIEGYLQTLEVIPILQEQLASKAVKVQTEAIHLAIRIGAKHKNSDARKKLVGSLLTTVNKAQAAMIGQIAHGLQEFKPIDFDTKAQQQLSRIIRAEQVHLGKWIELAGFLQMKALLNEIRLTHQSNKALSQKVNLALTRCGDENKKQNLLKNVSKMKVNDDFIYGVVPLLIYTRQKETTNLLFDIILSDQKGCTPAGPDVKGNINCAYRVMEAIAPYIEGMPLELGTSGDLKTTDYQKALKDTRAWIVQNKNDYELISDIF